MTKASSTSVLRLRWQKLGLVFGVLLLAYTLARLEFLWWNWASLKGQSAQDLISALVYGLRFDFAAAAMHLAVPVLMTIVPWSERWDRAWSAVISVLVAFPVVILLWVNLVDVEFVNFAGRRFTAETLFILSEAQGKMTGFLQKYWLLYLINTPMGLVFAWWCVRILTKNPSPARTSNATRKYLQHGALALLALVICVVSIRGGLQKKPMSFVNANLFASPLMNQMVLNSTFTIAKSTSVDSLPRAKFFDDRAEMLALLNHSEGQPKMALPVQAKPQNVVLIILESFALEYMGKPNGDKGWTPFLDELSEKSVFYQGWANGRRSIEGIAAIMAGIPALMQEPFISSSFSANQFIGLGQVLSGNGYHTSFFHGGGNGTMFFDTFMKSAGVQNYFGESEYPNKKDHDGAWGIYDEPFLSFFAENLSKFPQPFFSSVFTLSSHHPYKIPDDRMAQFPQGPIEVLASVSYADFALRSFFKKIESEPWYKDTLFVITADHTQKHFRENYSNILGDFRVPILFFHPGGALPEMNVAKEQISQIDLFPSILDFLGLQVNESIHLGRSIFRTGPRTIVQFLDQSYIAIRDPYWLQWSPQQGSKLYELADPAGKVEIKNAQVREDLERRLKAQIQYFSEGMWDNRLYYPTQ